MATMQGGGIRSEVQRALRAAEDGGLRRLALPASGGWPRGARIGLAVSGVLLCICATAARGQDATWLATPRSSDWNTGANWSSTTVPTDTATFGASNITTLTFSNPPAIPSYIGAVQLDAGAPAYTLNISSAYLVVGENNAGVPGAGIINNSSNRLIFSSPGPGVLFFVKNGTAGDSIINNTSGGFAEFADSSSAGAASITSSGGGTTFFLNTSTAGSATLTTNSGGFVEFNDASTADHATVVTNAGGITAFQNTASGGQAQFITNAGGVFDISLLSSAGMTAGSIAGAGNYFLGSKTLTVGSNNLSTEVGGVIADGGLGGGVGGSLVKVGAGTLTFGGPNTYTGRTMISAGTLAGGATNAFSAASFTTIDSAGTLDLGGFAQTINQVDLAGGEIANGQLTGSITSSGGTISATTLVGTIQTDPASNASVNLTNGSSWEMTGSSTVSSLALTNSVVLFAPPVSGRGFKTLTLNNYVGSGASIVMNASLGAGTGDQILINGGKATGQTLLTINNVGGSGAAVPLVVATNGGATSSNAFALAGASTLVVGGYSYTLQQSNQDWLLVPTPLPSRNGISQSVTDIAMSVQKQMITSRVMMSLLLGATEQINCSNCSSAFGSVGSYALGAHGRWALTDEVILMGGFSYNEYSADGTTVTNAPAFAGSVIYDPINFGRSRPFIEVGGGVVPFEQVHYSRPYQNGLTPALGEGSALDRSLMLFGRVGWVDRVTPIDEAAIYTDFSRSWLSAGGYTETPSAVNPFPATVQSGIDRLDVARLGAQWTHLFQKTFEVNVSSAVAYGFGADIGSQWDVYGYGPIAPYSIANSVWCEWGARIGYRFANRMVVDAFAVGTVGGAVGTTFHGGLGLRYLF